MTFEVRNNANIANKYIRFAKWKIRKLCSRFGDVLYTELYISRSSSRNETYSVIVKMGIPGPDLVVKSEGTDLKLVWAKISSKLKRQLRKQKEKRHTS